MFSQTPAAATLAQGRGLTGPASGLPTTPASGLVLTVPPDPPRPATPADPPRPPEPGEPPALLPADPALLDPPADVPDPIIPPAPSAHAVAAVERDRFEIALESRGKQRGPLLDTTELGAQPPQRIGGNRWFVGREQQMRFLGQRRLRGSERGVVARAELRGVGDRRRAEVQR